MQHVKYQWLRAYDYVLLGLDGLLFAVYFLFQYLGVAQTTVDRWGITPFILGVAGFHAAVVLLVLPFTRNRFEWWGHVFSQVIWGIMWAAIIETSGNTNIVYRLGFVAFTFFLNMLGPLMAMASVAIAWILFVFVFLSLTTPSAASPLYNVIIDILLTISAVSGWLYFRRYYVRDKATVELAHMLEQEQFKSNIILESITDGVIVVNTDGVTQIINDSAAKMLGWAPEEAHSLHYNSLYSIVDENAPLPEAGAPASTPGNDAIGQVILTGQPQQRIIEIQTHQNRRLFVDTVASPIFHQQAGEEGSEPVKKLVGVITVFRDIDERKREEQQRAEFISTASHEMRTPVAAIEGYLALAMNDKVCLIDEKAKSYLEKAHASTQHLGELFQDLLTSAKADDGRLASHPEVVEFGEFLEKLIEDLRFTAQKKGLALEFVMGTDQSNIDTNTNSTRVVKPLYYVEVDPDRIREVITNLFDNAVKYTASGNITIGLTGNKEVVQFYIKDTGAGIPPEDISHLFQKFYRVDNSATRTIGGTGLGLFICRKIVELYHGRIWVKSQFGKGSTFFVNLPRLSAEQAEAARLRLSRTTTAQTYTLTNDVAAPPVKPTAKRGPTVVQ